MALKIVTLQPAVLVQSIKEAIDLEQITDWDYNSIGSFTRNRADPMWDRRAWMRPYCDTTARLLRFNIVRYKDFETDEQIPITRIVYASYHGHLAQILLEHFDRHIISISITPQPDPGDDPKE